MGNRIELSSCFSSTIPRF